MALARHVDGEELLARSRDHPLRKHLPNRRADYTSGGIYAARLQQADIPKYKLPTKGTSADAAYQLLHDELQLDGNPTLNLATFVHTWMPPQGHQLFVENMYKNLADQDEYPSTVELQTRCVSILADLWKVPDGCKAIGTATGGSSEAIMLGGLAMKKRWQSARMAAGKDSHHPNIVFGANAQVALEKFARYFDVEMRLVPVDESTDYVMDPRRAMQFIDENTIGVIVILGSTYTGGFEDVKLMSDLLDEFEKKTGHNVPIHVDAASGGFLAPFAYPSLQWGFSLQRVNSINTSGHKYGLTAVGLGWIIWKDESLLPKELIFELHYLGNTEYSFNLNFSRSAAPVIAQMYNFINLGFEGYRQIALANYKNARLLSRALENSGYFEVLSRVHVPITTPPGPLAQSIETMLRKSSDNHHVKDDDPSMFHIGLPVVAFKFSKQLKEEYPHVKQEWIQYMLRIKQWIVPNYPLPPNLENVEILRVVIRESISTEMVEKLVIDILQITENLLKKESHEALMATLSAPDGSKEPAKIQESNEKREQVTYSKPC
ncbi:hypothetical protein FRC03_004100 [Tulasnella sp. 419]|nr:hypothetical protein FRC02_008141 [Tulasnella sp. 418]KAG8970718.1 hypothetical protein FRC03_004100 [Tulasnella sp. 419]